MLKVKLSLLALCLLAVAGSQLYLKGANDSLARMDQEAFDSYVHFAKQMHPHKPAKTQLAQNEPAGSVWDRLDGK